MINQLLHEAVQPNGWIGYRQETGLTKAKAFFSFAVSVHDRHELYY